MPALCQRYKNPRRLVYLLLAVLLYNHIGMVNLAHCNGIEKCIDLVHLASIDNKNNVAGNEYAGPCSRSSDIDVVIVYQGERSLKLSLRDALQRSEHENLQVLLTREIVIQVLEQTSTRWSNLLPRLSIEVRHFDQHHKPVKIALKTLKDNQLNGAIHGEYPVIDWRKIAEYKSGLIASDIASFQHEIVIQAVYEATTRAYLNALRDKNYLQVIHRNIKRDILLLALTKTRHQSGDTCDVDIIRTNLLVNENSRRLSIQATKSYASQLELKRLLNLDMQYDIELMLPSLQSSDMMRLPPMNLNILLENRPEYNEAQAKLKRSQLEYSTAIWDYLPRVTLFGDLNCTSEAFRKAPSIHGWTLGARLTVPMFEGLDGMYKCRRASSAVREQKIRLQALCLKIEEEYLLARQQYISRIQQFLYVQKKINFTREAVNEASLRFKVGNTDSMDIFNAQVGLANASDELAEATHLYRISELELVRSAGNVQIFLNQKR